MSSCVSRVSSGAERRQREGVARDVEHVVGHRLRVHERGVELGDVRVGELVHVAVAERRRAATRSRVRAARARWCRSWSSGSSCRGCGLRPAHEPAGQRVGGLAVFVGDLARRRSSRRSRRRSARGACRRPAGRSAPRAGAREPVEVDDVDIGAVAGREHAAVEQADGARGRTACAAARGTPTGTGRDRGRGPRASAAWSGSSRRRSCRRARRRRPGRRRCSGGRASRRPRRGCRRGS